MGGNYFYGEFRNIRRHCKSYRRGHICWNSPDQLEQVNLHSLKILWIYWYCQISGNSYQKERARDELPQSAAGRTIMTTEPKFVPNEAVEITIGDNLKLKIRLVDCVGYLINNALRTYGGRSSKNGKNTMVRY